MRKCLYCLAFVEMASKVFFKIEFKHFSAVNDAMRPADPRGAAFLPYERKIPEYRKADEFVLSQFLLNHHYQAQVDPSDCFRGNVIGLLREEAVEALVAQQFLLSQMLCRGCPRHATIV